MPSKRREPLSRSLKDALQQAGIKSSYQENERKRKAPKQKKKVEKFQEARNFCEQCQTIQPDVERYKHKIATVDARWICVRCADYLSIPDEVRDTHQSDFAKRGVFRREFGRTKKFFNNSGEKSSSGRREGGRDFQKKRGEHPRHEKRHPPRSRKG